MTRIEGRAHKPPPYHAVAHSMGGLVSRDRSGDRSQGRVGNAGTRLYRTDLAAEIVRRKSGQASLTRPLAVGHCVRVRVAPWFGICWRPERNRLTRAFNPARPTVLQYWRRARAATFHRRGLGTWHVCDPRRASMAVPARALHGVRRRRLGSILDHRTSGWILATARRTN